MSGGENTAPKTESKYPWSNYTLKLGSGEPVSTTRYVLYAIQIVAIVFLSWLSVAVIPGSYAGISFFYFVYPFLLVFSMWWGIWGMLGAYLGCAIGAGILVPGTGPLSTCLLYAISDFIPPFVAFLVYRGFLAQRGYDPMWRDLTDKEVAGVKTNRAGAWIWFVLINVVLLNVVSGFVGVGILWKMGSVATNAFWIGIAGWFLGDAVAMIIITPILVKGLTSLVERQGLMNHGWVT